MIRALLGLPAIVADYTFGTVIVLGHFRPDFMGSPHHIGANSM